jgi:hypothetical protein
MKSSPRVLFSLKSACDDIYGSNREQDNVSAALIQYAETEMFKHDKMLENCVQVDHTLSGFHVPEDATIDRASEKRAIMLAPKVFAKPKTAVEQLKKRLHEAPVTAHSREAKAYYKSISRKLDAYFSTKGKVVDMPPPRLIQALNKNADLAQKQTEDHRGELAWKKRKAKFNLKTRNAHSILAEQEKDWQNRRFQNHVMAPSYFINAVPHKPLVDFNRIRRCNLDVERPKPIGDKYLDNDINKNIYKTNKISKKNKKKLFLKHFVAAAIHEKGTKDTKDDLIKEVRARKYRGGGIALSKSDIYTKPKNKTSKGFNKHASIRHIKSAIQSLNMIQPAIIEKKKYESSPKEKLLRKLLQTKEDYYKEIENGIRKNIKVSMGGIVGKAPSSLGPSLHSIKSKDDNIGNASKFTVSYPSPFTSIDDNHNPNMDENLDVKKSNRRNKRKRMPPYFEIDEAYLKSFFEKKGDLIEEA